MKKIQILTVVWGMVVIGIFVLLTTFGIVYKNKSTVYKELEEKIVEAGKQYIDAKFLYPNDKEEVKTKVQTLIEEGYLDEFVVEDKTCDGYVVVKKGRTVYEYKGYVHCGQYKTKGYQK